MSATNLQNFSGDVQIRGTTFIKANTNTDNLAIGTDAGATVQGDHGVAVGREAGKTSQGAQGVAVGYESGKTEQGVQAIAMGYQAGQTSQGVNAVAVGRQAGVSEQGANATAIGRQAGQSAQGTLTTAVGYAAGNSNQGTHSVAVGQEAGKSNQGGFSTALGSSAGSTSQGASAVAIGRLAGLSNQGTETVAVGKESGKISQGAYTVAVGASAGLSNQGAFSTALGTQAGQTSQGVFATAIGSTAGMTNQEALAVAIGRDSGTTSQGCHATAVGYASGNNKQGPHATAVGHAAGQNVQGAGGTAVGLSAGATSQGAQAVAMGNIAGNNNQGTQAVAVGYAAGQVSQGNEAVAVGYASGTTNQGLQATAVGFQSGQVSQAAYGVAVGFYAGQSAQATNAVAVGRGAGGKDQGTHSTAVGYHAARSNQGTYGVAVGSTAGEEAQGGAAVAVGNSAGATSQGINSTAMGNSAGKLSQGLGAVAVGVLAGGSNQGQYAQAIGYQAGETSQGSETVAVGNGAGMSGQGAFSTALGSLAGKTSQGTVATAIGREAGQTSQGAFAIAIGYAAGQTAQGAHSIILNGTNAAFNSTTASSFHVKPVRGGNMTASALSYTADGEIVEQTNIHFDGSGNLGIATAAPVSSAKLDVRGNGMIFDKAKGDGTILTGLKNLGNTQVMFIDPGVHGGSGTGTTTASTTHSPPPGTAGDVICAFQNNSGGEAVTGVYNPANIAGVTGDVFTFSLWALATQNVHMEFFINPGGTGGVSASFNVVGDGNWYFHQMSLTMSGSSNMFFRIDNNSAGRLVFVTGVALRKNVTSGVDLPFTPLHSPHDGIGSVFATQNIVAKEAAIRTLTGNVGIGTNDPANTMHVYKAASEGTSGLLIEKASGGVGTAASIFFGVTAPGETAYVGIPKAGIIFERTAANGRGDLQFCVDGVNDTNAVGIADSALMITNQGFVQPGQINLTLTGTTKALGGNYLFQGVYNAYRTNGYASTTWNSVFEKHLQVFRMGSLLSIRGNLPLTLTSSTMNIQFTWAEVGCDGQRAGLQTLVNQCTATTGTWNAATGNATYLILPSTGHTGNGGVDYQNLVYLIDLGYMSAY